MPKRNRLIAVLAMPAAVFLWSIGWALYWYGPKRAKPIQKETHVQRKQSELQFTVAVPEEEQYAK